MKRKIICFFIFFGLCNSIFPQTIENDDYIDYYDFIGIYLPVEFIILLIIKEIDIKKYQIIQKTGVMIYTEIMLQILY